MPSLLSVSLAKGTDGLPWATFQCDCTQTTVVRLAGFTSEAPDQETAYTCDHCGTTHWFWILINEHDLSIGLVGP